MLKKVGGIFGKKSKKKVHKEKYGDDDVVSNCADNFNCSASVSATGSSPIHGTSSVLCVAALGEQECLSGAQDGGLILSNIDRGEIIQQWTGHGKDVVKVASKQNDGLHFSASRDKTVNIWTREHATPVRQCVGHDLVVSGVAVSASASLVCTGSRDNTVRLWNTETGQCIRKADLAQNLVTHVRWGNVQEIVAQSGEDKMIHVWDVRTLRVVRSTAPKQHIQTCCDLGRNDEYCLASSNGFGGTGCEATLWDVRSMRESVKEFRGHTETITSCCFLASHPSLCATCSRDNTVRLWSTDTGECLSVLTLSESGALTSVASNVASRLLVGTTESGVVLLSVESSFSDSDAHLVMVSHF